MTVEKIRYRPALKCQVFVAHIQKHLKNGEYGSLIYTEGRQIARGKVGCKICERSIDQIWNLERKGATTK